mmetsp:Transcript_13886/g.29069  ORF Transcript_13886/g.29069 Transcript_13886/m.29069 type:complete len:323 (-) Transcript_13886:101-1069(-)
MSRLRAAALGSAASKLLAASAHVSPAPRFGGAAAAVSGAGADCLVEVTDLPDLIPGDSSSDAWAAKAKVALQQLFKKFGPVMEVRIPTAVACVRFGSARSAEAVLKAAPRGFLRMGEGEVRVRLPGAQEAVWRKFPPRRGVSAAAAPAAPAASAASTQEAATAPAAKKRKLRPNERFATRLPGKEQEAPDESERLWEEQHERSAEAAAAGAAAAAAAGAGGTPQGAAGPEEPAPPTAPERPVPTPAAPGASAEDIAVCQGEEAVAEEMAALLDLPFSQQKKALKALRRQWHPDKRPDDQEVATRVFQFIQAHDVWLAHHDLC